MRKNVGRKHRVLTWFGRSTAGAEDVDDVEVEELAAEVVTGAGLAGGAEAAGGTAGCVLVVLTGAADALVDDSILETTREDDNVLRNVGCNQ